VDKAEEEGELARRINAEVPGLLGDLVHRRGVLIIVEEHREARERKRRAECTAPA